MKRHVYQSTYCLHAGLDGGAAHHDCRLVCKMCSAPCICECHDGDSRFTDEAHERRVRDRMQHLRPLAEV